MAYFIRQSSSPEKDIERGFSAVGSHVLGSDEESAMRELALLNGIDADDDPTEYRRFENAHEVAFHAELGGYVQPRRGLCAHAEFETLDEAREAFQSRSFVVQADAGAEGDFYAFEGSYVYENSELSLDDGCVFRATGNYWKLS